MKRWIGGPTNQKGEPAFMFLHFYDVHYAYDPPAPYSTAFDRAPKSGDPRYKNYFHFKKKPLSETQFEHQIAQYDEALLYVDAQLRRLQEAADKAGRNVQWVITSDHGEVNLASGVHGAMHTRSMQNSFTFHSSSQVATYRLQSLSRHGLPITILPQPLRVSQESKDCFSDGLDLMQYTDKALPERQLLSGETTRFKTNRLSLTEGEYRLEWDLKKNKVELFRPLEDPKELVDLSKSQPEALEIMKQHAEEALGKPGRFQPMVGSSWMVRSC